LAFGVTAKLITGSGKPISGASIWRSASRSTSPVCVSLSFATAPMSPSPRSATCACSFPCTCSSWPKRSFEWTRAFTIVESPFIVPLSTRKTLMRPAKGSAMVLKTNAAVPPPSTLIGAPFFAGDGTPSTSRSSRAVVPRFFEATPHATGKTSPRVTASFNALATSSVDSSWPSR
jgi:hypothetical protein